MSGDPTFDEVKEVVDVTQCPVCSAARLTLTREMHTRPIGTYSVAGQQMKLVGVEAWIAVCSSCDARFAVGGAEYD